MVSLRKTCASTSRSTHSLQILIVLLLELQFCVCNILAVPGNETGGLHEDLDYSDDKGFLTLPCQGCLNHSLKTARSQRGSSVSHSVSVAWNDLTRVWSDSDSRNLSSNTSHSEKESLDYSNARKNWDHANTVPSSGPRKDYSRTSTISDNGRVLPLTTASSVTEEQDDYLYSDVQNVYMHPDKIQGDHTELITDEIMDCLQAGSVLNISKDVDVLLNVSIRNVSIGHKRKDCLLNFRASSSNKSTFYYVFLLQQTCTRKKSEGQNNTHHHHWQMPRAWNEQDYYNYVSVFDWYYTANWTGCESTRDPIANFISSFAEVSVRLSLSDTTFLYTVRLLVRPLSLWDQSYSLDLFFLSPSLGE
ncbi:hypothetical protein BaRGS_00004836 [Batillaria attramentaria]|uniref:Uncharacterized protein n=1 Tax=Batillaria attramentaria TaxID=370345 RepID=A0ABD0LX74_9CAEN